MWCGARERLEVRLGDVTLEDPMPLHFYGIKDGSRLNVVKPYIIAMVKTSHGNLIYWRLDRKDTIREVKAELASSFNNVSTRRLHLFLVSDGKVFHELDDDDEIVENCIIKDDAELHLLIYRWTSGRTVTVMGTGRNLQAVEAADTCLDIKVKAQHQMGVPFNNTKIAWFAEYKWVHAYPQDYVKQHKRLEEINDEQLSNYSGRLHVVTEKELQADWDRVKEEEKAWRELIRKNEPIYPHY